MKVIQVNQTAVRQAAKDAKFIELSVKKIVRYLGTQKIRNKDLLTSKKELTVVLLSPQQMKKINFQYRKKNKPTDILSFAGVEPVSLGELLLCPSVLKKQAKEHDHSMQAETFYMLVHGLLHLLGYDHEASAKEEKLMFRIQDQCFKTLGPV
ncbi:MAG: putative metal-dependent hydrolase [Pseudobdellovibrio sp.]|jgi:probable rRNA maturation factor|nr:putative metal-dependent hydrolase [Pseudobdellovibrio sp.]